MRELIAVITITCVRVTKVDDEFEYKFTQYKNPKKTRGPIANYSVTTDRNDSFRIGDEATMTFEKVLCQ